MHFATDMESLLYVDSNQISQRPPALPSPQSAEVDDSPVITPFDKGRHHRSIQPMKRVEFRIDLKLHEAARSYQTCISRDISHQRYLQGSLLTRILSNSAGFAE